MPGLRGASLTPSLTQVDAVAKQVDRQALSVSANWLWNFFVVMITPTLIENLAWKGYLVFMCLNLSFVPVCPPSFPCCLDRWLMTQIVYFFYPETANLTLEEIDYLFMDRRSRPGSVQEVREDVVKDDSLS